ERIALGVDDGPELVEEGAEDRLLVREVMVDVPGGDFRRVGDVADGGGAIAAVGEQIQRGVEYMPPASLRPFLSLHCRARRRVSAGRAEVNERRARARTRRSRRRAKRAPAHWP